ncbi:PAS domain-containing protein [Sphingomonas sp.]|uniref:PAS domain-containing sensor histidine kinase n=1 Tax=Sphingomonas sp. TaxID=28214 RepID=UPI00333EDC46
MPKISNQNLDTSRAADARHAARSPGDGQVRESLLEHAELFEPGAEGVPQTIDPARAIHAPANTHREANPDHVPPSDVIALMLADAMPQMVWSARADGYPDYFNALWYAATGLPDGSSNGSGWNDVLHIDDRQRACTLWRSSVETGHPFEIEFRLQYHACDYRWTLGRAQPIRDAAGSIIRWVGTCTDIDDVKQRAAANALLTSELKQSTALLHTVVEVVPGPIYAKDRQGRILFANKAALDLIGKPFADIENRPNIAIFGNDSQADTVRENDHRAMDEGTTREIEEIIDERDTGPRLFLSTKAPFFQTDEKVAGLVSLSIDITERQELAKELLHVSKRTAMGDMAAAIAHEINQPLAAISLYLEAADALLENESLPAHRPLALAKDQCHRAGEIIKRVRSFVSGSEVVKCPENLTMLVDEACNLALIGSRESGITTTVEHKQADTAVFADRVQIEQVIMNLVRNAMDAMGEMRASKIHITTTNGVNGMAMVTVSDIGPGISSEVVARLYEPFVSTKGKRGMGVGLSICRTIVEDHGGKIWAEPGVSTGTSFHFTLPICEAE